MTHCWAWRAWVMQVLIGPEVLDAMGKRSYEVIAQVRGL